MGFLIDSDCVIDYLGGVESARVLFERLAPDQLAISMVTYMEVYQGILRSQNPEEALAHFADFLTTVPVLPFSHQVAERCASLREALSLQGQRIRAEHSTC